MAITTNGGAGITADAVATLSNKTLSAPIINNATFTGQQSGLQIAFNDAIVFEGTTADANELTLSAGEPTADRTVTLPDATTTLVGTDTTQTLTNKTLTSPVVTGLTLNDSSIVIEGATADAFETTLTITDPTADRTITFPDSTGTVALTSDITVTASSSNTFTNKSIALGTNTVTGTIAQFNTAVTDADFATLAGSETLTNKSISLTTNTVTATLAELNTAISDADVASLAGTETFTNKTLTTPTLNDPKINLAINAQTGTTYTFVLTDNGKVVTASNASSQTYTIPPVSSVAFPTGANFTVVRKGAGAVAFAQGSGVTIRSTGATATAPTLRAQYSTATCIHEGSDVWYVVGDIA